ncbi:MAG: hypothetical protein AAF153_02730, partial [Pseudomonadota bacterium]
AIYEGIGTKILTNKGLIVDLIGSYIPQALLETRKAILQRAKKILVAKLTGEDAFAAIIHVAILISNSDGAAANSILGNRILSSILTQAVKWFSHMGVGNEDLKRSGCLPEHLMKDFTLQGSSRLVNTAHKMQRLRINNKEELAFERFIDEMRNPDFYNAFWSMLDKLAKAHLDQVDGAEVMIDGVKVQAGKLLYANKLSQMIVKEGGKFGARKTSRDSDFGNITEIIKTALSRARKISKVNADMCLGKMGWPEYCADLTDAETNVLNKCVELFKLLPVTIANGKIAAEHFNEQHLRLLSGIKDADTRVAAENYKLILADAKRGKYAEFDDVETVSKLHAAYVIEQHKKFNQKFPAILDTAKSHYDGDINEYINYKLSTKIDLQQEIDKFYNTDCQ